MKPEKIKELLLRVQAGELSVDAASKTLESLPFADLGHTVLDNHRELRTGFPEVIYGENKTPLQLVHIVSEMLKHSQQILATRVDAEKAAAVQEKLPAMRYDDVA
ncbi:MAG: 1-(5-phosphoribosyl)-5-amino-4-imidazole-carboxylate carboxylase, partial [Deltaproteobacteria bacterium]|nr:1-(5-phosphoribosyl)-5-amino-4-imidazole-carboxylate carboxylase [Deltaproteobacteria bacterium]